jgi:putative hemolysin
MDDPVRVMSTVQVAITAIGILTGAVGQPLVEDVVGEGVPGWLSFLIGFATVTYLSVVLGELVPKALTLHQAETLVVLVARPIHSLSRALRPLVWLLEHSAAFLLRPFGVSEVIAGEGVRSADELRAIVDEAEESGVIPEAQEEMLHNVFEFAHREAGDVMVPAADVAWIDAGTAVEAALDHVVEQPHGRYPVGRGSLDRLAGVVHLRDLVAARRDAGATAGDLAHPAIVVPETKDLGPLLRELREQRQQLAVVVDEYGNTAGIVSIEDVLEEIVGEIEDEYDLPDATLDWIDDRTVEVTGSMSIDDFNETVHTNLPQTGQRTLAGLCFHELGRQPSVGDSVVVEGVRLTVAALEEMRITRLAIRLPDGER